MNKVRDDRPRSIFASCTAGFVTCLISPYYMILLPLVLPEMMDITIIEIPEFLIIAVTTFMALSTGPALVVGFASQLRRLARSARSTHIMNNTLATILVVGGGWMALT